MDIGFLPREDPGVFRTLLLPETADALAAGEAVTALGLTENGLALGAAAGYLTGDRFHVSSLYVAPAFRRRGGGALLLDTLQVLAVPYSGGLECAFTVTQPDHQTLIPFLEREGFFPEALADAALYRTTLGEIAQVPFFAGAEGGYGTPLDQLDEAALSLVERTLRSAAQTPPCRRAVSMPRRWTGRSVRRCCGTMCPRRWRWWSTPLRAGCCCPPPGPPERPLPPCPCCCARCWSGPWPRRGARQR